MPHVGRVECGPWSILCPEALADEEGQVPNFSAVLDSETARCLEISYANLKSAVCNYDPTDISRSRAQAAKDRRATPRERKRYMNKAKSLPNFADLAQLLSPTALSMSLLTPTTTSFADEAQPTPLENRMPLVQIVGTMRAGSGGLRLDSDEGSIAS